MKSSYPKVKKNPVTFTLEDKNGKVRYVHGIGSSETDKDLVVTFIDRGRTLSEYFPKSEWRVKRTAGVGVATGLTAAEQAAPDASIAVLPQPPLEPSEKTPGNLMATLKGEYNAWVPPDKMGPEFANRTKNDAQVAANFTIKEAERKVLQSKARQQYQKILTGQDGSGVQVTAGFVPD